MKSLSRTKVLIFAVAVATVFVWYSGTVQYKHHSRDVALNAPTSTPTHHASFVEPTSAPAPKARLHEPDWPAFNGLGHLRGSGLKNRTQIGAEKASLVMLVRCVVPSVPPGETAD